MAKEHIFTESEILTPDTMNKLTQDSQIVQSLEATKLDNSKDNIATTKWVREATGDTTLNAASATRLLYARVIGLTDADASNNGSGALFNGTANATLRLPSTIKATLYGNATSATKLQTARRIYISDATSANQGTGVNFDGSGNVTLKLPTTIKAELTGNSSTTSKLKLEWETLGDAATLGSETGLWLIYFNNKATSEGASAQTIFILGRAQGNKGADSTSSIENLNRHSENMYYVSHSNIHCDNDGTLHRYNLNTNGSFDYESTYFGSAWKICKISDSV